MTPLSTGRLTLVPTPIGNLEDITLRAINVLKTVDLVLAEDTRTTGFLMKHHGVVCKQLMPYHLHNEHKSTPMLIEKMKQGATLALCTDAGTPGISDPGYLLVNACVENNIAIECLPGATALIPALVCSGFGCEKFVYEGFLPLKKGRSTRLKLLSIEPRTIVVYESPHRIKKLIDELVLYFGENRQLVIARELSKKFEEYIRGSAAEVKEKLALRELKGEIVVVVQGTDIKKNKTTEQD
jgi:16S rRNA (cytidine1402-2'-O)-methyltransferase